MAMRNVVRNLARQEGAYLATCARQGAGVRELLRARDRGWPGPPLVLASQEAVDKWMADGNSVDQQLGVLDRTRLWMSLRLLNGLDLEDFLRGSRHAYHVVSDLTRGCKWQALSPLVQPTCLEAMQELGPNIELLPAEADESISIVSAVLSDARVLEPSQATGVLPGTAHLDVRFSALQSVTMHDMQHGERHGVEPRLQESTWTFEGVVSPDAADDADAPTGWRVVDIAWQVWEVQQSQAAQKDYPGWPTHGP